MPKIDQDRLEARRAHILKAAKACFAQNGFHKTTMRDILKKAGLSAGAVYSYFKSKEDIIEAIALEDLEERIGLIGQAAEEGEVTGRFTKLAEGFFSMLERKEKPYISLELELWAEAKRNPKIMKIQRKTQEAIKKRFLGLVESGRASGQLRQDLDPEYTVHVLISLRRGLMAQLAVDRSIDVLRYTAEVKRLLFGGLGAANMEKK